MVTSGDWLVPHANGEPYAEKPPLYWWGTSLLSLPGGRVTAVTARLGGALYALGCVFLLALLVKRWFGDAAMGVTAAALFSGTLLVAWNGSRAGLDLPLTFWILLTVERGWAFLRSGGSLPALACGAAWAGAVLVKGPLGFLFPPIALAAMAWGGRRVPRITNPGWILMVLALAGLGLAWLLPALDAGGQAYADRLLGQIRGRATGAEGHHLRPIWYYVVRGAVWSLPWLLLYVAGFRACLGLKRPPSKERAGLAACCAIGVGGFLFLSVLATKREVYLVPLFPFLAAAGAYALHRGEASRLTLHGARLGIVISAVAGLGLLVAAVGLPVFDRYFPDAYALPPEVLGWGPSAALALAGALFAGGAFHGWRVRPDPIAVVQRTAPWMLGGLTLLLLLFLPPLDALKSYAPAARAAEQVAGDGPVYNAGFGQGTNLLWSLDRTRTQEIHDAQGLRQALLTPDTRAAVVAGAKWWDRLRESDPEAVDGIQETWRSRRDKLVVLGAR